MTDKDFLNWLSLRIVEVYGESPMVDFVHKLNAIAERVPEGIDTKWYDGKDRIGYRFC